MSDGDDGDSKRELLLRPIATLREIAGNNRRLSQLVGLGLIVAWWAGWIPESPLPSWWPVALVAVGSAAAAGWHFSDKVLDLLPDEEGIYIVEFRAMHNGGGAIYNISEEAFSEMLVLGGDLYQWDESPKRVYEVREYDRANNIARANWRESRPGSALARYKTVEDVMAAIRDLRENLEPDAAKGKELRRRLPGIVRQLDKERARAQDRVVEEHTAPSMADSRTIQDVLDDVLDDDDLHPTTASTPDSDDETAEVPATEPSTNGASAAADVTAAATDGGKPEDSDE